MAFSGNIFIFSGDTGSGKTTLLADWAKNSPNVGGIVSPVIDGKRHFVNVGSGDECLMESQEGTLKVGRFTFNEDAFDWAGRSVLSLFQSNLEWIIIDETGPLELKQEKGFHQLITQILQNNGPHRAKLLFVVRAALTEKFVNKYGLNKAKILPRLFFNGNTFSPLAGIVLCGGESLRMKKDKAVLQYGDLPQWKVLHQMLNLFCDEVLISVNENQVASWPENHSGTLVTDKEKYSSKGPLTGILSCMEGRDQGCFIVAVDYPLLKTEHLIALYNARNFTAEAVCFTIEGRTEPLVSILEPAAVAKLKKFTSGGGNSLNKFLREIRTDKVELPDMSFMLNVNTQDEFQKLASHLEHLGLTDT